MALRTPQPRDIRRAGNRIETLDIAWLAGLLEGEGCFWVGLKGKGSATISLSMTDREIVERAATLMGTVARPGKQPKNVKWRQKFTVSVHGTVAASWMMTILPLMGARRAAKIIACLGVWKTQRTPYGARTHCKNGHPFTGDNFFWRLNAKGQRLVRGCRTCQAYAAGRYARSLPERICEWCRRPYRATFVSSKARFCSLTCANRSLAFRRKAAA
jgi:hypothetical protein